MTSAAVRKAWGGGSDDSDAEAPAMIRSVPGISTGSPKGPVISHTETGVPGTAFRAQTPRVTKPGDAPVTGHPPQARQHRAAAAGTASRELRHYLRGQALHLLGFIEERVEQDQLGAGRRDVAQAAHAGVRRSRDGHRGQVPGAEEPVEPAERGGHPLPGGPAVVCPSDVDPPSAREPRG